MITFDLTPFALAAARVELQLLRQKLAMRRIAFIFELKVNEVEHNAVLSEIFHSQKKLVV